MCLLENGVGINSSKEEYDDILSDSHQFFKDCIYLNVDFNKMYGEEHKDIKKENSFSKEDVYEIY